MKMEEVFAAIVVDGKLKGALLGFRVIEKLPQGTKLNSVIGLATSYCQQAT